jgi:16S rRNA (adenine1518-N6/adenine1519-N6)-dimethyltransferase
VAVELDEHLAGELAGENVTVVTADVLKIRPEEYFAEPYTVVANLPYHITSPALRHLLGSGPPYAKRLVVMVQAEVADRIAASPGAMSALAVVIQAQAQPTVVQRVPATAFYPRPKVDSAVLVLEPLDEDSREIQRGELNEFMELVQAGFKQPRKMLANSLADGLGITKAEATDQLEQAGIEPSKRPESLAVEDWVRMYRCFIARTPRSI